VFTLVGLSAAGFALFWGITLFAQRYLYNEPADKLPLRAAVAGLLLGCFLTGWVYVNTRADGENKYGVLHQFSPNDKSPPVAKFQAVRLYPNTKKEETVPVERVPAGSGQKYQTKDAKDFRLNSGDYLTTALILDDASGPVRYEAVLDKQQYVGGKATFKEPGGKVIELSTGAAADAAEPVAVVSPSGGVVFLALALNALHLVVWFGIFWPILRFSVGHAVGFAVVFFAMFTVLVMPLLFDANKVPKVPVTAPPAAKP
jgi:hypothetical protein